MNTHEPPIYGIGACLKCLHLFLSTPTARTCPLCGHLPAMMQPLQGPVAPDTSAAGFDVTSLQPPGSWGEGQAPTYEEPAAAAEEGPPQPLVWEFPCPCCRRDLVAEMNRTEFACYPAREYAGAGESVGEAADVPAEEGTAPAEGGAVETEEPVAGGEPPLEADAAGVPVRDDAAAPPSDDTPPTA